MEDRDNKPVYEERDASFEPDPEPETTISEEELQDSILADSDMNAFQKCLAKMNDRTWNLCQRILGAVLGILSSVALFWDSISGADPEKKDFSYSLIVAVVIAILVPNIIEKQGLRKIPKARTTMAITLLICIAAYVLYLGISTVFNFRA